MSFFARLKLALRLLFGGESVLTELRPALPPPLVPIAAPPLSIEQVQASALFLLAMLQREGRLLDFLQEDVTGFSDADVGAASRVVHSGCRKVLQQYVPLKPVLTQAEGESVTVPAGFDANRYRLTGNVSGQAPYKGSLKHHGWVTEGLSLPTPPTSIDLKVLAPAEVELP